MRILCSTAAGFLLLVAGTLLAVRGQTPSPVPGGSTDDPPAQQVPRRAQPPREGAPQGQPPGPQPEEIDEIMKDYDRNRDGVLTPEELPSSLRQRFRQIDTNKDGRVSRRELEQGLMHLQPEQRPSDLVFALVEMSEAHPQNAREVQRIYDVLRKMDRNQDGKLDDGELRTARQQILKDRITFLFTELDADKDGMISKEEARGQLRQDFNRLDTNRDGYIDRQELMRAATARPPAQPRQGEQPGAGLPPPDAERAPPPGTRPRTRPRPPAEEEPPPAPPARPGRVPPPPPPTSPEPPPQ